MLESLPKDRRLWLYWLRAAIAAAAEVGGDGGGDNFLAIILAALEHGD